jgi:hypothetical protein
MANERTLPEADPPPAKDSSAAVKDWVTSTQFEWGGHQHNAHLFKDTTGRWFVQVEDADAYEVPVATSVGFRMGDPMLESVRVYEGGKVLVTVVNQSQTRLVAKELFTLERNVFHTPPVED